MSRRRHPGPSAIGLALLLTLVAGGQVGAGFLTVAIVAAGVALTIWARPASGVHPWP